MKNAKKLKKLNEKSTKSAQEKSEKISTGKILNWINVKNMCKYFFRQGSR